MTDLIPGFHPGQVRFDAQGRACLTDMWRVAGSDLARRPVRFLRSARANRLFFDSYLGAIPGLEVVHGGNHAGTWAPPAVAREYAFHLAPRFHVWRRPDLRERFLAKKHWPRWESAGSSHK